MARRNSEGLARITAWFESRAWRPFPFQRKVWREVLDGRSGLVHAATGTGKTYAPVLGEVIRWIDDNPDTEAWNRKRPTPHTILWITPLRALAADTTRQLAEPIDELGLPWRVERRTGDTSSSVKARQNRKLPTLLVTTPESLEVLISQKKSPELFTSLRLVVVDEWHELLGSKRGTLVELALARLRRLAPGVQTWGLSATIGNLDQARHVLLGDGHTEGVAVRGARSKKVVIDTMIPKRIDRFPWAGHLGMSMVPQVIEAIAEGGSSLIFTNTRAQTERWYQAILEERPEWAGEIALHHGSLDRDTRRWVEAALAEGSLRAVVSTSTLDLGVDFAPVDRVMQVGSPKGVARLVQRAGRSGHRPGRTSRVTAVPTNAFEIIESAAARDAVRQEEIEPRIPYDRPLDVLLQHMVTVALGGGFRYDDYLREVRSTWAFRNLSEEEYRWALAFLTTGGEALKGYPEYRRVVEQDGLYTVEDKTIAKRHRVSIGTILSDARLRVKYMRGGDIGALDESFISRLRHGDTFIFAGRTLEFVRIKDMTALVRRSTAKSGTVPRFGGARLPVSEELAEAIRVRLDEIAEGKYRDAESRALRPIFDLQRKWSAIPRLGMTLLERVKSRRGHHLFLYPFAGRSVHEGLGALLAWRLAQHQKVTFTIAHNDYGIELLSKDQIDIERRIEEGLFATEGFGEDLDRALNRTEMARRGFREIARISGLVFPGYPGSGKTARQMQASSGLIFDVLERYDPENLLLAQARRETLERGLEYGRMERTLQRIERGEVRITTAPKQTPLGFPLSVERLREQIGSETLAERIRRMVEGLEKRAQRDGS